MTSPKIERALISVSDKTGLTEFAQALIAAGVEIYASGGSRKHLEQAGIPVREVAAYTGFPEIMDGRIKTLHPKIHGGILCRRDRPDDMAAIAAQGSAVADRCSRVSPNETETCWPRLWDRGPFARG